MEGLYRKKLAQVCKTLPVPEAFGTVLDVSKLTLDRLFIRLRVHAAPAPIQLDDIPARIFESLSSRQRYELLEVVKGRVGLESLGHIAPRDKERLKDWLSEHDRPQTMDIAQALIQNRHLAISGPGGSGKTTIIQWLGLIFSEGTQAQPHALGPNFNQPLLPILIDLKRFAGWFERRFDDLQNEPRRHLPAYFVSELPEFGPECLSTLLSAINLGDAFILADGVDEILNQKTRNRIIAVLRSLISDEVAGRCFLLISGRPHACPTGAFGPSVAHLELLPFTSEDVHDYLVYRWYPVAYGQSRSEEAKSLSVEISETAAITRLAINPLICTLLAAIYRGGLRPLPRHRTVIFDHCCRVLIHRWDNVRCIAWPENCSEDTKLDLLAALAFTTLSESSDLSLPSVRVHAVARTHLRRACDCSEEAAAFFAHALLKTIRDRAGLLEALDDGSYAFSMRPFLDFLVAHHISRFATDTDVLDHIMSHVFDGAWREPIVMAGSIMGQLEDNHRRLSSILHAMIHAMRPLHYLFESLGPGWFRARRDRWFESHLLRLEQLAAQIFREIPEVDLQSSSLSTAAETIISRCRKFLRSNDSHLLSAAASVLSEIAPFDPTAEGLLIEMISTGTDSAKQIASQLLGRSGASSSAVDALLVAVDSRNFEVRLAAVQALGVVGCHSSAIASVLARLAKDESPEIRTSAIDALATSKKISHDVVGILLDGLKQHWYVPDECRAAAKALGSAETQISEILEVLLETLDHPKTKVRAAASDSLARLALSSSDTLQKLLRRVEAPQGGNESAKEWTIRCGLVHALGKAAKASDDALKGVINATRDTVSNVRRNAVEALQALGKRNPQVIEALQQAASDSNHYVGVRALSALSHLGAISDELEFAAQSRRWSSHISDPDVATFFAIADADFPASDDVIQSLMRVAQSRADLQYAAARRLGKFCHSHPDVMTVVVKQLSSADANLRTAAAGALLTAGREVPEAVHPLVEILKNGSQEWARHDSASAAHALAIVGPRDPFVLEALEGAIADSSGKVRRAATHAIARVAKGSGAALSVLKKCLRHDDPEIREIALRELGSDLLWQNSFLTLLLPMTGDRHARVRITSAEIILGVLMARSELRQLALPRILRMTHWRFRPRKRAALFPVLGIVRLLPETESCRESLGFRRIYTGTRSWFPSVRKGAYDALFAIVRDRPLPSFSWPSEAERVAIKERAIRHVRLMLAPFIAMGVLVFGWLFMDNLAVSGIVSLFSLLFTLFPIRSWFRFFTPPKDGKLNGFAPKAQ